jgi:glycosyltransferase involved in cell wall biosynthesis
LGTLEKRKNVLGLISAFELLAQKIPDLHLVIAGAPGWGFAEIYARAKASKYAERILFLGYIHEDERMTFYSLAKVFVYPSFYEGFGMPPLEAMSCGTPVVTSAASSLPEAVGDAALLINPHKTDDLADAILACLTNDRLRKKLISAGAEQIKKFSWDKAVRELNDVFRKII